MGSCPFKILSGPQNHKISVKVHPCMLCFIIVWYIEEVHYLCCYVVIGWLLFISCRSCKLLKYWWQTQAHLAFEPVYWSMLSVLILHVHLTITIGIITIGITHLSTVQFLKCVVHKSFWTQLKSTNKRSGFTENPMDMISYNSL